MGGGGEAEASLRACGLRGEGRVASKVKEASEHKRFVLCGGAEAGDEQAEPIGGTGEREREGEGERGRERERRREREEKEREHRRKDGCGGGEEGQFITGGPRIRGEFLLSSERVLE